MKEQIFWKKFPNFFQFLEFWSAFYSKTAVFETNFSQKGLAGICSYSLHMWSRPSLSPPRTQIWCPISSRVTSEKSTVCGRPTCTQCIVIWLRPNNLTPKQSYSPLIFFSDHRLPRGRGVRHVPRLRRNRHLRLQRNASAELLVPPKWDIRFLKIDVSAQRVSIEN